MAHRIEQDDLGEVAVAADAPWGAQTQRALEHFRLSDERMPAGLLRAMARVKRACARVNGELGLLEPAVADAVLRAVDALLASPDDDRLAQAFPLSLWQSGSGTQSHMNLNEVLARSASRMLEEEHHLTSRSHAHPQPRVHPNDHVNRGQSTNDVLPTALQLAAALALRDGVVPALARLRCTLEEKARAWSHVVKPGRTHLQDALPVTLGQELASWEAQLARVERLVPAAVEELCAVPIGATAVGTGFGAPPSFGPWVAALLAEETGLPLRVAAVRAELLAAADPIVHAHGLLRLLAGALTRLASDVRWMASGPHCGLQELELPHNEPGSSMMPGKANPTQAEALLMACMQVAGNDVTVGLAGNAGNFELNTARPLLAQAFLQSARLLADGMTSFEAHALRGLRANEAHLRETAERSLMLATALAPHIGHHEAARLVREAERSGRTLRETALGEGKLTPQQFDAWVRPREMAGVTAHEPGGAERLPS